MPLLIRTHYKLAISSLRKNRGRSFLTCLGIGIGIASVILILSLMGSINSLISTQVESLGSDLIVIRPTSHDSNIDNIIEELTTSRQYLKSNLSLADVRTVNGIDSVSLATPIAIATHTITAEQKIVPSGTIVGTDSDFLDVQQNVHLKSGSFIGASLQRNSAVIGHALAQDLFGTAEAIGKTFTILGQKFIITGLLESVNDPINFNNVDFDQSIIVDAEYLESIDSNLQVQQINARITTTDLLPATSSEIANRLSDAKAGDTNFSVSYGSDIAHPANSLLNVVSNILTLVAGISLIVGGMGIMNIMLVTVAERTHEIGVRKAVGASNFHIFAQFLLESLLLSLSGGLIGLALGYALAFLISTITPFAPYISQQILLVTIITTVTIGTIFGLYPAIRASHKNPIESLKHYR